MNEASCSKRTFEIVRAQFSLASHVLHELLATVSGAGHNDCWALYLEPWKNEVKSLLEQDLSRDLTHSLATFGHVQPQASPMPRTAKQSPRQASAFEISFPAGAMVETHSLSTETMNGIQAFGEHSRT